MTHDHRKLGAEFNNRAWDLIEKCDRTPAEDEEMIAAAHASLAHWMKVGGVVNQQRGQALIARAYAELGRLEPAMHHLALAEDITRRHESALRPLDIAILEALAARVHALAQNPAEAERHYAQAERLAEDVDEGDRRVLLADLAAPPWFGFRP